MTAADYTVDEVATRLGKSADYVRRQALLGQLPGAYQLVKRGRWSIRRRDFDDWHASLGPKSDPNRIEPPTRRSLARRH